MRKAYAVSGVSPGYNFLAFNNTILGIERAIKERLIFIPDGTGSFKLPPNPPTDLFYKVFKTFTSMIDGLATFSHPLERQQFAACYDGRKRQRYLNASQVLSERNLTSKDAERKVFMKYEYYNYDKKKDPVCRAICPGSDEYLVETGRYFRPIEKKVYRAINKIFGHTVIMKGLNQSQRGDLLSEYWEHFDEPVCVAMDASRFEQSVKEGALSWEHDRYFKYYRGDRYFAKLMAYQHTNKGRTRAPDGKATFELGSVRSSGDANTALGNCLISSASMFSFMEDCGINNYRTALDGDDVILFINKTDLIRIKHAKEWYDRIGFRMKIENPAYEIEEIDFCQSRPVWTPDGYLMVRNILDALSKDSISKKNVTDIKTYQKWMAAVGRGGICLNGGIPVAQSFYQLYDRLSNDASPLKGVWDQYHMENKFRGMNRTLSQIHPRTRASFYYAFGLLPEEQLSIEEYYSNFNPSPLLRERGTPEEIPTLPWGCSMPTSRGFLLD